jgi:PAS domain S-box-containing protein
MPDSALPPELLALRHQFAAKLGDRLKAIRDLYRDLVPAAWVASEVETLHRMVHSLTGSAGTLGMPKLSDAARRLESELSVWLRKSHGPDAVAWSAIGAQIACLQPDDHADLAEAIVDQPPPVEAPRRAGAPLVHLGVGDAAQMRLLVEPLREAGYRVQVFSSLDELRGAHADIEAIQADRPFAVALDSTLIASEDECHAFLVEWDLGHGHPIPVVMALSDDRLEARLRAMRVGVNRTLSGPLQPGCLIESLDAFASRESRQPWRVLMVDDDPELMEAHAAMLRTAGMEVQTLSEPLKTLDEVERFQPDVLLLDVYMPQVGGPELAAALRQRDAQLHLPILFLSAETDMTQQLLALNLGGDDFLIKPVLPAHLVAAVTARARRAQQVKAVQNRLETTLYERQREHLALDQHAIVSIADRDGIITYANEMFCRISGYGREELIGRSHHLLKSNQHAEGFVRAIWERIRQGHVWHGEMCSRRKDGSDYWAETSVTPFLDASGQIYQYIAIQTDISHIKAAQAALRRQHDIQRMTNVAAAELMAAPISATGKTIETALRHSAEQLGADRADLFGFSEDGELMRNLYVWCSPDGGLYNHRLQQTLIEDTPWMREQFLTHDMVVIPDVAALPPEADEDRRMLQGHLVRSLLVIPLHLNGRLSGFLSYCSARPHAEWTPEYLGLLRVLTEVIGSAMGRRRAEQALRDSEARLNFLVSSSPVTIYTCETRPPFAATYVSPNVNQLLGFEAEAFLKAPALWVELVHPEDRSLLFEELPRVLTRGTHQHEYRSRTRDGDYIWVLSEMRLVRNAAGKPLEVIGYVMDITARKRIERELFEFNHELEQRVAEQTQSVIESERISRATLDAMSARVVILDERGVILAANQAWRDFQRPATGDANLNEGANYLDLSDHLSHVGVNAGSPIAAGIRAVMAGEKAAFLHEYAFWVQGEQRWALCRVEPFPGEGAVRVVVSHEDITQMKLIERQQMRSQRLESLGTLAGGVAHDLNNALAPVLMGMDMLKEDYPAEGKMLDMIQGSARRGADMVRQLLTFAKGAEGERVAIAIAQLVKELESMMRGSFPKDIELNVDCQADLPVVVGDATQLHQILLNLCVNARDAMPDGGTLSLQAEVVVIDPARARLITDAHPGHYVVLRVRDTGTGIAPEIVDRIFDPFFTTKAADRGTGLGLSTVLGLVKSHGGFLQVQSIIGEGSTFLVHLPAAQVSPTAPVAAENHEACRGQGETILFVDDEPAVREVGRSVLERLNFHPVLAKDGADALIQLAAHTGKVCAVVTDLHMPRMDGLALVRSLRDTHPDLPVVMASGRVDESVAQALDSLRVTARLDKPFTETQLAQVLSALLLARPPIQQPIDTRNISVS